MMGTSGLFAVSGFAQNWQSTVDKMWGSYCYREKNGTWLDAQTSNGTLTTSSMSNNIVLAYYWRIPKGNVRADMVWTNAYLRVANMQVVVTYPATGDTLATNTISSTGISSQEHTDDLFGTINFPEDDFYRVQITSPNWNYVKNIKYFNFQRESTNPVLIPRNFGGTSPHMNTAGSSDPDAPNGSAYDWAYVECMTPKEYSYTGTFYMPMSVNGSYMGMQNVGPNGNDVNRSILFSVWDNGNMDANPHLPIYLQSRVMDGNQEAVHTHAGGEGSSASVMLKDSPHWWRPGHWIQFLLNMRPEVVKVPSSGTLNPDSTFDYSNTIMSVWYKVDTMPAWRYLATIRNSGRNNLLQSWGAFMEPFTTYHGQMLHRMFMRNGMLRSAASGKWYHINRASFSVPTYDRDFHYDVGRGASSEYPGTFFMDMGAYIHIHDSASVVPLATDKSCVDTINTDRLLVRVEEAIHRDSRLDKNWLVNETADFLPGSTWTVDNQQTSGGGVNGTPSNMIDDNDETLWSSTAGFPNNVVLSAKTDQTLSSMYLFWQNKYSWRARLLDVYTSEDGADWQLAYDSLEIRCEDTTQVSFPHPVTASHFKFVFYKGWDSNNLSINTLKLRGAYNLDRLKALARRQITHANQFTYFSSDALKGVIDAYQDGQTTDANALAAALRKMFDENMPLNYARVTTIPRFTKGRAYVLQNMYGYGYLVATPNDTLTVVGATNANSSEDYKATVDLSDPYANWLVLRDERYSGAYLYNVGAKKWLNLSAVGHLSDEPQNLTLTGSGNYYFRTSEGYVATNSTTTGFSIEPSANNYANFYVYDNYQLRQSDSLATELQAKVEPMQKVELYKSAVSRMLEAPLNVVGGFTSEQARQDLKAAYDNANQDTAAFIRAVENVDVIAFDPDHEVYNITSTYSGLQDKPYFSANTSGSLETAAQSNDLNQIWRFQKKNDGYTMHSNGRTIMPYFKLRENVRTSTDANAGIPLVLDEISMGAYAIGLAQNSNFMISGMATPMNVQSRNTNGVEWRITPQTTYSVSLNSAGVRAGYFDFAIRLPEGLNAYTANYVTPEGVIKLTQINGIIPPNTPVLLRGEKYQQYTLDILNTPEALDSANIFRGSYERNSTMEKGSFYTLSASNGVPVMRKPALPMVNAGAIYLNYESGMPQLDTYTFDFDDLVDAITTAQTESGANMPGSDEGATYTLDGRRAVHTVKGNIYIRNHRKILAE